MTNALIYWLMKLDDIRMLIINLGIWIIIGFIVYLVVCFFIKQYPKSKLWISFIVICCFLELLYAFLPNTKQMLAIVAVPMVVNSKTVQEIPSDLQDLKNTVLNYLKKKPTIQENQNKDEKKDERLSI